MGGLSIWHWLIVLAVIVLLFGGGGKIPRLMGDFAKGIKSFKSGLKDEKGDGETADSGAARSAEPPKPVSHGEAAKTAPHEKNAANG
jgi:sec-independent protein translocase protein TatA